MGGGEDNVIKELLYAHRRRHRSEWGQIINAKINQNVSW